MLQIELFNRLDPKTREHHIDDTFIVLGPFNSFQWTYGHLRLQFTGGEIDLRRLKEEAVIYDDIILGDFRIVPYDSNDKRVKPLNEIKFINK